MNAKFPLVAPLTGTGTTTDSYVLCNPTDVDMVLDSVYLVDDAGVTANDTNYATVSVELDGVEVATLSTTTTGSGDFAADTGVAVPVSNSALVVAANGGKVEAKLVKAGTGVAIAGRLVIVLKPSRS